MDVEEVLVFIKKLFVVNYRQPLTPAQEALIRYCYCEDKTYDQMEEPFYGYSIGFIRTQLAPRLWESLTQVTGKRITKRTLKSVLTEIIEKTRKIDVVGDVIRERYKITKIINKGAFSKICLAQDLDVNNQLCMIKQVTCPKNDVETRRRLNTEVGFLYQLNWHRQIPGYIAHFEDEESFYIVYRYVEGEALNQQLPEDQLAKPWEEEAVINLLLNILNVLEFVHKRGMIHRDIKPSNLIQGPQGEIYLINFGLIKEICGLTKRSFVNALIEYGAPEQLAGAPKLRSDIYSVAMIGIQALTGIPPRQFVIDFETGEIIWQNQARVSKKLAAILDKAADPNWQKRQESVTEIITELKRIKNA